jgi:hypothetical protein
MPIHSTRTGPLLQAIDGCCAFTSSGRRRATDDSYQLPKSLTLAGRFISLKIESLFHHRRVNHSGRW